MRLTEKRMEEIRRWCESGCYGHQGQAPDLLAELDRIRNGPFEPSRILEPTERWQVLGPGYWRACDNEEEAEDVAGLLNTGWRAALSKFIKGE